MPIMPRLPTLPIMPTPPIPPKAPRFPFGGFQMPFIPLPKIPTAAEMASVKPGPNQVYNGVAVKSSSSFTRDKDGKLVRTGGTHILVNDNGEVQEEKFGTRPPNLNDPIVFPSTQMPEFKFSLPPLPPMPPIPPMPPMPAMPPIKPIIINPLDIEMHQPGENEHFVGVSTSSYSHSSNINGVEKSGGGAHYVVNVDGEVEKEILHFGQGDKE